VHDRAAAEHRQRCFGRRRERATLERDQGHDDGDRRAEPPMPLEHLPVGVRLILAKLNAELTGHGDRGIRGILGDCEKNALSRGSRRSPGMGSGVIGTALRRTVYRTAGWRKLPPILCARLYDGSASAE
jgi:hypothetical protein